MIIRSLAVKNIRSYNDGQETRIDLPEGVVLFEGDVGSGKSTILYALEFALFGLSDMKGAHLLSEGRKEGSVSVTFESGGIQYIIDRQLKQRGRDVVQDECHITSGRESVRLSPSDLKERVISILGFNEPTHPKAESLVYRYAVFTPQEQMKEILLENSAERLQVIRRVLGAQTYQIAAENSELVEKKVKTLAYGLLKASEDLEEKRDEMKSKSSALAQLQSEVPRLQEKEEATSRLVRSLEADWKDSMAHREVIGRIEARIPLLRQDRDELQGEMAEYETKLLGFGSQLADEIEPLIRSFEARLKPAAKAKDLEANLASEREKLARLEESKEVLDSDFKRTRDLLQRGFCPLCGQRISGDLSARTVHSEQEMSKVEVLIVELSSRVASIARDLEAARAYEEDEKEYTRAVKDSARVEEELKTLRRKLQHLTTRLSFKVSELEEATTSATAIRELSAKIADLESRLKLGREEERNASLELNRARTELAGAGREFERLSAEVKRKQDQLDEARRLNSYQGWLSSFFRPTVELIEKQMLDQAASRFNEYFQRFFVSLVDDPDMVVRVNEDFSPIFEREGFAQDFEALSGGERTSMALAYRFALNSIVKEDLSSRPELVILDEPTDGFSREQVYKMRGLLETLDSRQVILVSHERELESMADHIFKVEKRNGTSTVLPSIQP
jgi:exonuclease SbcC